jgi:hypothetical protein
MLRIFNTAAVFDAIAVASVGVGENLSRSLPPQ